MAAPAIEFVAQDGYSIAYSSTGEGIPFVFMPAPTNNIHLTWAKENSLCPWVEALSSRYQLIQYDWRGQGMSSRGLKADYAMRDLLRDLDAVIQRLQLRQFVLMGSHISAHTAVTYAIEHPERVRALILGPCGVSGRSWPVMNAVELARDNWQFFLMYYAAAFMSEAARQAGDSPERTGPYEMEALNQSVTQRDWNILARVWCQSEIEECLPRLATPTLVIHPRNYLNVPSEKSVHLASRIQNARLALIDGYTPLGKASSGVAAIEEFLNDVDTARRPAQLADAENACMLTPRELEVLGLIANGATNREVAETLTVSVRTVERHITHIYDKIGARGKADATAFAIRHSVV